MRRANMMDSPFTEYRKDGWPLCPQCGKDELMSLLREPGQLGELCDCEDCDNMTWHDLDLQSYINAGMLCLWCDWRLEPTPNA